MPRLLINMHLVGSFGSRGQDCVLPGDLVESVRRLAAEMKCAEELERLHKDYQQSCKM